MARAVRRRHSASSSESSGSDAEDDRRRGKSRRVLARHQKHPGRLAEGLFEVMTEAVGERLESFSAGQPRAVAVAWLLTVYLNQHSAKDLGPRTMRELRTLCHTLDLLIQGKVAEAMDVLAQRVKALERAQADGHWDAAQWMELIPTGAVQLIPRRESRQALREAEEESKLRARRKAGADGNKKFVPGSPMD